MSVGRICCREVELCDLQESVQSAAERMRERRVGSLVVVDEGRRPVGLLTDRDVTIRVVAAGRDARGTRVQDVMTMEPSTIRDDETVESAVSLMRAKGVRRVPVVDASGQLVGILTLDDVLDLLAEELEVVGGILSKQRPRRAG